MTDETNFIHQIVHHIKLAQAIATNHGYGNLLQPGMVKELIIGDILGHEVHKTKHDADAWDPNDRTRLYEYLTCYESGTFQLDRMFKNPSEKRQRSLERINRCHKFYCAIFAKNEPLTVKEIYEVGIEAILSSTNRQLDNSSNDISHICFTISWVKQNGIKVYPNP